MRDLHQLGYVELLTPAGTPVGLEEIWRGRATVLTLTRHFGCLFCFEQVETLLRRRTEIEDAGAQLVVVGNGNPKDAGRFQRHVGLTGNVFTDPARRLYRMLDLVHGVRSSVNWRATVHARRALGAGFRPDGVRGDRWQQGGTLVADSTGRLLYSQRCQVAGEPVDVDEVLRVVTARSD